MYGLKGTLCDSLYCTADSSARFFFFSFKSYFASFWVGEVARVEDRYKGVGRWMGSACMMWSQQYKVFFFKKNVLCALCDIYTQMWGGGVGTGGERIWIDGICQRDRRVNFKSLFKGKI